MTKAMHRFRRGLILLGAIFASSVVGYWSLGYPWIEAVWMVVITIASVGYGERSQQPPTVQIWTVVVILVGLTAAAYTFASLMQVLFAGELDEYLGRTRMSRDIKSLNQHTIVVGYGRIGRILAADLHRHQQPFVLVESADDRCREARDRGFLFIVGDATDDDILIEAGATRARCLVSALPNDANNVFITLTARNLNKHLKIIARAEHSTSERKLLQAGANRIVMPSTIGAQQIGRMITRPHTADLLELFAEQGNLDVAIDELALPEAHALVGKSLQESEIHHQFGLLVLAIRSESGELVVGAGADYRFAPRDVLIVFAKPADVDRFRKQHNL